MASSASWLALFPVTASSHEGLNITFRDNISWMDEPSFRNPFSVDTSISSRAWSQSPLAFP